MKNNNKIKQKIISGVLAGTILISPVFHLRKLDKNKEDKKLDSNSKYVSSTNCEDVISTTCEEVNDVTIIPDTTINNYNDINIDTVNAFDFDKSKKLEDFITDIDNLESIYDIDFSELRVLDNSSVYDSCDKSYDINTSDVNELYQLSTYLIEKIKQNSKVYLSANNNLVSAFLDDIDSEYRLDQIATQTLLKDAISNILKTGTNKDICLLENLKIAISYSDSSDYGDDFVYYSTLDNSLIVFPNKIRNSLNNVTVDFWNTLKYSIQYKLNEVREQACECQDKYTTFPYETLYKAALSSELYNLGKSQTIINNIETRNENLILALGLFQNDISITDYYNSIFNNDIQSFYRFCGVSDNNNDIYKLNKALYAMDVMVNNYNDNLDGNKLNIGYDYRVDIFSIIIKNMMHYTAEHKDFRLNDNLILFNIIKNLITVDVVPNELATEELNNIIDLNNMYINFLCNHYKTSYDRIVEYENSSDINNYVLALSDICHTDEEFNVENVNYVLYSSKIIKRFPILRMILSKYRFNPMDYENIININYNVNVLSKKR